MDSSNDIIQPLEAFKSFPPTLKELKSELNQAVSIEQIDNIVNRAVQAFKTALQTLPGRQYELQTFRMYETIQEISLKILAAKKIIKELKGLSNEISDEFMLKSDFSLPRIQSISEAAHLSHTATQQRAEALSREQEVIQDRIRLLQEKKGLLTAFRKQCEEFSQIFTQMCSRAEDVDSSLTRSSSRIEESGSRASLSVQQVSGIVHALNNHMEELSRVEGELRAFSTQTTQYTRDVDRRCETISGLAKDVSELQSGFFELQTSMAEIQRELAAHQQQTIDGTTNSPNSEANNVSSSPIDGELTLAQRVFIWTLKAIFWYKDAYNHTSLELSIAVNSASQWTKHQITPYIGVYQATIITNPKLWVTTVLFILYWKGVLRKAAGCYMLGCAIFHARARPMVENHP